MVQTPRQRGVQDVHDGISHDQVVVLVYTNYRGERATRRIIPERIWFGATDWHPEPQWLLDAFDIDRGAERSFAIKDVEQFGGTVDVPDRSSASLSAG